MTNVLHIGLALLGTGCLLCVFTSRQSSRRLDHEPWYVALELLTLALLLLGAALAVVGALGGVFIAE
jgi:hypothetical protein